MPVASYCAYCYARIGADAATRCAHCNKRQYCCPPCQEADWQHGHRQWCGASGELQHDFTIQPITGKGLGLVTLRPFRKCDVIMVERALLRTPHRSPPDAELSPPEAAALWTLCPDGGSMLTKIEANQMSCQGAACAAESGVFVTMARANHSCLPNAEHYYSERDGVKRLSACRDIAAGQEICISYTDLRQGKAPERRAHLRKRYSFNCTCAACEQPELAAQLDELAALHAALPKLAQVPGTVQAALDAGERMLALLDSLRISELMYVRAYYDLFQVALLRAETRPQAACYISLAAETAAALLGEHEPQTQRYRALAANPQQHRNYGLLE